jgi:hypothetical protein
MLQGILFVTNDLTLGQNKCIITLGKAIKPFFTVPTRCFWWMQTISRRTFTSPVTNNKKVGLFQY